MNAKPIAMYALVDGITNEEVKIVSNNLDHYMQRAAKWMQSASHVVLGFKMMLDDDKMHWFIAICLEEYINPDKIDQVIQGNKNALSNSLINGFLTQVSEDEKMHLMHTMYYMNKIAYRYTKVEEMNLIYEGIMANAREKQKQRR